MQTMNKQQFVCKRIAIELLMMYMEGHNRLRAVKQYAEEYGVGTGTVQSAFQTLKDMGAVELTACGANGTYMTSANQRKLFEACGYGDLICLMPLDANLPMRSLATGIYESVSARGLPIHMVFARGSRNRVIMLDWGKADFAVMSRLAYEEAVSAGEKGVELVDTVGNYPGLLGVFTRRNMPFDPAQTPVSFDRYSYDQVAVHTALRLQASGCLDCLDVQLPDMVRRGEIEAALGRCVVQEPELCFHPLPQLSAQQQEKLRQAVLVTRAGEESLRRLLRCIANYPQVAAVQEEVIAGKRMVKY